MDDFRSLVSKSVELPEDRRKYIPKGFQRIGNIIILSLPAELDEYKEGIGNAVLSAYPGVKTVCNRTGKIEGELRKPQMEVISGDHETTTIHTENGCFYKVDVSKVMFSKGNVNERARLLFSVEKGETIIDMFAGIGYFTIPIAKNYPKCTIYAIELNPDSVQLLKENCKLNNISNVTVIQGDCREVEVPEKANRILMGYLPGTDKFLPHAFRFLGNVGTIHYHDVFQDNDLWEKPKNILEAAAMDAGYVLRKITYTGKVKQFSPHKHHVVLDADFTS